MLNSSLNINIGWLKNPICRLYDNLSRLRVYLSSFILMALLNPMPNAWSTVVKKASLESLVQQAQIIAHVRVAESWSPKTRGKQGEIYTYTRLIPLSTWVGQTVHDELLLVQLGGQIGELRLEVHGDAELKAGDEVVLFLSTVRKHLPVPSDRELKSVQVVNLVSLAQGAFFVNTASQERGDLRRLKQNLDGLVFYSEPAKTLTLKEPTHLKKTQELWTLKTLQEKVQSLKKGRAQ